ncbi:MAG: hypothetical protein ACRCYQ_02715 [Nocardioides sp.]
MTTIAPTGHPTDVPGAGPDRRPGAGRAGTPTWRGALYSEWLRLRTTRSTWVTLLATGFLMGFIGIVAALTAGDTTSTAGRPGLEATDPLGTVLAGQTPVQLIVAVLGVMIGARDYGTGLVRTTYAAVPHRWRVLIARVLIFAASAFVVIGIGIAVAFVGGNAIMTDNDLATTAIDDEGALRALLGTAGYLVGIGVMGICLGTLTRGLGSGIGIVVGLVLVLPGLGQLLIPEDYADLLYYLPSNAGTSFGSLDPVDPYLGVGTGAAVFVAWLVGVGGAAWATLSRRDV